MIKFALYREALYRLRVLGERYDRVNHPLRKWLVDSAYERVLEELMRCR